MMDSDWQNPLYALDVNDDGFVVPLDALILINEINRSGSGSLTEPFDNSDPTLNYIDVSGDGFLSPIDPLIVINQINLNAAGLSLDVRLAADTGESSIDRLTNDSRVSGQLGGIEATVVTARARLNRGVAFDVVLDSEGRFVANPALHGSIADGSSKFKAYVQDADGRVGLKHFSFDLDTTPPSPPTFDLDAASDTAPLFDRSTMASSVRIEGQREPLTSVALVGNSLAPEYVGEKGFAFSGLALAAGSNPISVKATDKAGNSSEHTVAFFRQPTSLRIDERVGRLNRETVPLYFDSQHGARTLSFDVTTNLDTSAQATLADTFSVYLIDASGTTLLDRGVLGTALFALDERGTSTAPDPLGVVLENGRVSVDISAFRNRGNVQLVFELFNGDSDIGSSVEISNITLQTDTTTQPVRRAPTRLPMVRPVTMTEERFAETTATANVEVLADNLRVDLAAGTTTIDLRVVNRTGATLGRDLVVAINDLVDGVTVADAFALDSSGNPLIGFQSAIPEMGLPDGVTSGRITLVARLDDPLTTPFTPTFSVRARTAALEIYDRVRNAYEFVPYRGAMRGADGVRDTLAGNAWDITTVLVEELRAAGIPVSYAFDTVQMSVDDVINWLGAKNAAGALEMMQAANLDASAIMGSGAQAGQIVAFEFDHCWAWVNLALPGTPSHIIDLDASFKRHSIQPGIEDIATLVPFDYATYLSRTYDGYVDDFYAQAVTEYLDDNMPGKTVYDVPATKSIIAEHPSRLAQSMFPFTYDNNPRTFIEIPDWEQNRVSIEFRYPAGIVLNTPPITIARLDLNMARDGRKPISVVLGTTQIVLTVGDDVQVITGGVTTGSPKELIVRYTYADDDDLLGTVDFERIFDKTLGGGETIGIALDGGQIGPEMLASQWKAVNAAQRTAIRISNPTNLVNTAPADVAALIAMEYFRGHSEALQRIAGLTEQAINHSRMSVSMSIANYTGSIASPAEYHPESPIAIVPSAATFGVFGDNRPRLVSIDGNGLATTLHDIDNWSESDQERAVWERMFNGPGMNTIRSIQLANENGIPLLTIDSTNKASQLPLLNLPTVGTMAWIEELVDAGAQIITPQTLTPLLGITGVGFIVGTPGAIPGSGVTGFLVSGGTKGALHDGPYVSPPCDCAEEVPSGGGGGLPLDTRREVQSMRPATGELILDAVDIDLPAIGFPLTFARRYISSNTDDLGMGVGWIHSYSERLVGDLLGSESVIWITDEGRSWTFERNSNGTFKTPPELDGRLSESDGILTYREKNGIEHIFNSGGKLIQLKDRFGSMLQMVYDTQSRLVTVYNTVDTNRYLNLQYENGHVVRVNDSTGRTWSYGYRDVLSGVTGQSYSLLESVTTPSDGQTQAQVRKYEYILTNFSSNPLTGLLRSIIEPDGLEKRFDYYPNRWFFQFTQPNGGTGTYFYDVQGRRARYVNERGFTTIYQTDEVGHVTTLLEQDQQGLAVSRFVWQNDNIIQATDPLGHSTYFVYDDLHNLIRLTDAQGGVFSYEYDTRYSLITSHTDALGHTTSFQRDSDGNLIREVDPLGQVTTHTYDRHGQRLSTTTPKGNLTPMEGDYTRRFSYNSAGMLVQVATDLASFDDYVFDTRGNLLDHFDANGHRTSYAYDILDRRIQMSDALQGQQEWYYDVVDRVIADVDELHRSTVYVYNRRASNATTIHPDGTDEFFQYDTLDNPIRYIDQRGFATEYVYDPQNRLTTTFYADGASEQLTYDVGGRLIRQTDALGSATGFVYDALDRLIRTMDAHGQESHIEYDAVNNITALIDRRGNRTQQSYDANDQLIRITDALGQTIAYTYDANGNIDSVSNQANKTTMFTYDVVDRLVETRDALDHVEYRNYDLVGNLTELIDRNGNLTTYEYDALNRVIATADALSQVATQTYDAVGNILSSTDRLGRQTSWRYDRRDRLLQETRPYGDSDQFTYDAMGNLLTSTDALGRITSYEYDIRNRRTKTVDAQGGQISVTYDRDGNVVSSTDELGRVLAFSYDALDRILSTTDALGGIWINSYDAEGNVLSQTDALGRATLYQYDALNRLTTTTDAAGGRWTTTYDAPGNLLSSTDANNHTTLFAYDALNRLTKRTDAAGNNRQYSYDRVGNLITDVDERGKLTSYEYDVLDRLVTTIDAAGGRWNRTYDAQNNLLSTSDANGHVTRYEYDLRDRLIESTDPLEGKTQFSYDAVNNLTGQTDALGRKSAYTYDSLNRIISQSNPLGDSQTFTYDAAGNLVTVNDELDRKTRYTYDALDRVIQEQDRLDQVTHFTYDAVGNLISVRDRLDRETKYSYDALNRLAQVRDALSGTVKYGYDAVGNVKRVTDQLGREHNYQYDALNRLITVTDALLFETRFAYDAASNLRTIIDALGRETSFVYDALNRRISQIDPTGRSVLTEFDPVGNIVSTTDELGRTSHRLYDALNRLTRFTDPLTHKTSFAYDAVGNLLSTTDALGHISSRSYDALDRLLSTTDSTGATTTYEYDEVGDLVLLTDPNGNLNGYEYDANNRLVRETNQLGGARVYDYDAEGNPILVTDRNGRQTRYTYDGLNRLVEEAWLDSAGEVAYTIEYGFDAVGNLLIASDPAASLTFSYDVNNRRSSYSIAGKPNVPSIDFNYTYDGVGNLLTRSEQIAGQAGATNAYQYDTLERVNRLTQSGGGAAEKRVDFTYDAASQLTGVVRFADLAGSQEIIATTNVFDDASRLTSITHAHAGLPVVEYLISYNAADRISEIISPDGTSRYAYNERNELVAADHDSQDDEVYAYDDSGNRIGAGLNALQDNRLQSDGTYEYLYDAEGNRTRRTHIANGEVTEYQWDYRNRLTSIVTRASEAGPIIASASYTYDALDNRIAKSVDVDGAGDQPAIVTRYVVENDHIALQLDGQGDVTHRYLYAPGVDQVLADEQYAVPSPETLWPLLDHAGTVRDLVDSSGAVVNHITYDSFGDRLSETNAAVDHLFGFTGREFDAESGLVNSRARYYDPAIGSFISQDPIGFAAGDINLYRYAANDPLNVLDPTGLAEKHLNEHKERTCYQGSVRFDDAELEAQVPTTDAQDKAERQRQIRASTQHYKGQGGVDHTPQAPPRYTPPSTTGGPTSTTFAPTLGSGPVPVSAYPTDPHDLIRPDETPKFKIADDGLSQLQKARGVKQKPAEHYPTLRKLRPTSNSDVMPVVDPKSNGNKNAIQEYFSGETFDKALRMEKAAIDRSPNQKGIAGNLMHLGDYAMNAGSRPSLRAPGKAASPDTQLYKPQPTSPRKNLGAIVTPPPLQSGELPYYVLPAPQPRPEPIVLPPLASVDMKSKVPAAPTRGTPVIPKATMITASVPTTTVNPAAAGPTVARPIVKGPSLSPSNTTRNVSNTSAAGTVRVATPPNTVSASVAPPTGTGTVQVATPNPTGTVRAGKSNPSASQSTPAQHVIRFGVIGQEKGYYQLDLPNDVAQSMLRRLNSPQSFDVTKMNFKKTK